MRAIAELNVLLRTQIQLPVGLKLATDEFREGWNFVRSTDARRLEKRIQTRGWNFIKIADGELRSGVGETSQLAIASALKLALRRVSTHFNAVEVEHIELTQYPWFFWPGSECIRIGFSRARFCLFRMRLYRCRSTPGRGGCHPNPPSFSRTSAARCPC